MFDSDFLLDDRVAKIKSINEQYDLEHNAYISFSGGKDSTVLHHLVDLALPNNKIPRVFLNTGIEYKYVQDFVKELSVKDERVQMIKPSQNVRAVLETFGYPFKSKEHSEKVYVYQKAGLTEYIRGYLGEKDRKSFVCPKVLKYQFTEDFKLKVSSKCCSKMKKEVAKKWAKENEKSICMTGVRRSEGGVRLTIGGCTAFKNGELHKFHPLYPMSDEWMEWFIKKYEIKLCKLYYPPFNFKRTGCKGCPFDINLQSDLNKLEMLLPAEYKQCNAIWKPVYDEYKRIGYRLTGIREFNFME